MLPPAARARRPSTPGSATCAAGARCWRSSWSTPGTDRARTRAATAAVAAACHAAGLLVLTCGTYGNVLRFLPPLVIADDELGRAGWTSWTPPSADRPSG